MKIVQIRAASAVSNDVPSILITVIKARVERLITVSVTAGRTADRRRVRSPEP